MTRTKKKSSSPKAAKPSVVNAAWNAFFSKSAIEDIEGLRKQGWRSVYDVASATNETANVVARRLNCDLSFERQCFRVNTRGKTRDMIFFRPKLKG
jgi:hypothetical protein